MAGSSSIEWTDATWNPTRGCSCTSPGCKHCYAMKVAARFSGPGLAYEGLAKMHPKAGGQWTGKLRLVDEQLDAPLRWTKPRRIFVNSMSDLFHEALTIEQIAEVFAVMYLSPRHTFQVLTKRATRMREVLSDDAFWHLVHQRGLALNQLLPSTKNTTLDGLRKWHTRERPAPWVHLGVSIESPEYLERGRDLKSTPAAVRFLSCEPLLAELSGLRELLLESGQPADCECGHGHAFTRCPNYGAVGSTCHEKKCACPGFRRRSGEGIHWVIVGGESGPGARPLDLEWVRRIVGECSDTGTPVFVKQLGAKPYETAKVTEIDPAPAGDIDAMIERSMTHPAPAGWTRITIASTGETMLRRWPRLKSAKGGDMAEWPEELRVRQFPEVHRAR